MLVSYWMEVSLSLILVISINCQATHWSKYIFVQSKGHFWNATGIINAANVTNAAYWYCKDILNRANWASGRVYNLCEWQSHSQFTSFSNVYSLLDHVIWIETDYGLVRKYDQCDLGDLINLPFIDDSFLRLFPDANPIVISY